CFLVNRDDCRFMSPARDIDPVYTEALIEASKSGVELMAFTVHHTLHGCRIDSQIPIRLP
ncbi:MAG: DNA/RNA nuclease SfsA, partial [Deltaproteobacteria bacterium]|nr:DNA/RNA nuclease SfsA [Deltaproteobacteria bacterium]